MSMGLEARCGRFLDDVVTVSQGIRRSVLAHANGQNLCAFDRLRVQLEMIRVSADTILEACTRASLTSGTLDDRMIDWLLSGELPLCLNKLKEMDAMLNPVHQTRLVMGATRPLRQAEDKLSATIVFFEKHKNLFHFLLTPDVWDRRNGLYKVPPVVTGSVMKHNHPFHNDTTKTARDSETDSETEAEYETASEYDHNDNNPLSSRVQAMTRTDRKQFLHAQQKLDEVSRWLAPLDCTEKHADTLKLRQEGTCKWFPNADVFKKWRAYGSQFLWLHGKAGCGKSVLIASTIEHLKKTVQEEEVVVFFYCDFRNERSTTSTEVMRSILSQLIRHTRDCGVDPGDLPNKILEQKSEGSLSLNDLDKLGDLVSRTASRFRYEPIIVIDALDECADMEALLHAVVALKEADVRLLVTGRPHQMIMGHFKGLRSLSIENVAEELAADIFLHVEQELDSRDRLKFASEGIKNEVHAKLTERAEGRFRWVQCQLDALNQCASRPELREALENLPNELEATYEIILGAIDERKLEGELARRALTWLVVALEPLRLAQVVDGLSMIPRQQKVDRGWLRGALLDALSSLVSHNKETDVLALSHFSVKEYLTSGTALPMYQVTLHEAHGEVAQMCMSTISVFLKAESSCRNTAPLQSIPMLSYVLSSGFDHLGHVDLDSTVTVDALQSLGLDVRHHPSHWERLCELREELLRWPYPPWPSSRHDFVYYILIAYSSPGLLKLFFSHAFLQKPRAKTNPLVYAADLRKTEHAMTLMAYGADVNMPGLVVDDSRYALPLDIAIDLGEDVLVGELLQKGCVVTSEVLTTAVCMPWCSSRVLLKLMQTDEFVKWAREIGDEKLYRGVFNSARPNGGDSRRTDEDHVAMARILCQIGQNLHANSRFGAELAERAIHAAHTSMLEFLLAPDCPPPSRFLVTASTGDTLETVSVIRFLLRKGVDIHAISDGQKDTALHLAVMCSWEPRRLELMQLLMEAGCDPAARNSKGKTVFALALELGHTSALELLLSYDVSIPSDTLPFALQKRLAVQVVELLIQKGADLHTTFKGNTIFHLAVTHYSQIRCLDLVKIFIKAGCDPNVTDSEGKTVFEIAISHDHTELAELLLSHNVPLPTDILATALQKRTGPKTLEFLIRKGADLHCTMPDGSSIFCLAIVQYSQSLCLDLVKSFIEAGGNPITFNFGGKTVLEAAIVHNYTELAELLLSHNVPLPSDILATALQKQSDSQTLEFLIKKGANLHCTMPDGDSIFHLATVQCPQSVCLDLVKSFIEAGGNLKTSNFGGKMVLEAAIVHNYTDLAELLLLHNIPLPSDILATALHKQSDPQTLEFLIKKGANLHCTMSDGDSIFHLAIVQYPQQVCLDLVKSFIEAGANPITSNFRGKTVLEAAIVHNYTELAELLLSHNIPLPSDILATALQKRSDPWTIEFLISKGANLCCTMPNGDSIFHLALIWYPQGTCLDLVNNFLKAGCYPVTSNPRGKTALEIAIGYGYTSVVQLLLSYDAPFPSDVLPLALLRCGTPQIVQCLILKGADVHSKTPTRDTVLHLAVTRCRQLTCLDLVRRFAKAGCDPTICNLLGLSVLETALLRGYDLVLEYLLSRGTPCPPHILPVALQKCSNPWVIKYMIQNGANVHFMTADGEKILELALNAGYSELASLALVNILIDAGCGVTVQDSDPRKAILENASMKRGDASVTQFLLSCNIYPPSFAILFKALQKGCSSQMVQFLAHKCLDGFLVESESRWDTLLHIVHASYVGQDRDSIVRILSTARKGKRVMRDS